MKTNGFQNIIALLAVFCSALAVSISLDDFGARSQLQGQESPGARHDAAGSHQMREGTAISDRVGKFKSSGERLEFEERTDKRTYICLENLMLQRVQQSIRDEDREIVWHVTGHVTEYMNRNYLLIEKVTRSPTSN